mmetsp:Transcript_15941/g.34963  ORF Transcript_15941/g.34963 Transcript_15941/m.34963 type:complete len:244 (+) Transcript_15941:2449-3180(+)
MIGLKPFICTTRKNLILGALSPSSPTTMLPLDLHPRKIRKALYISASERVVVGWNSSRLWETLAIVSGRLVQSEDWETQMDQNWSSRLRGVPSDGMISMATIGSPFLILTKASQLRLLLFQRQKTHTSWLSGSLASIRLPCTSQQYPTQRPAHKPRHFLNPQLRHQRRQVPRRPISRPHLDLLLPLNKQQQHFLRVRLLQLIPRHQALNRRLKHQQHPHLPTQQRRREQNGAFRLEAPFLALW